MTNSRMGAPAVGQGVGTITGKQTLIEDDTEFKGTLSSKCPVVVRGSIEGEVSGPSLHVSPTGSVSGKVKVGELRSEGVIAGEFDADTVQLAGTVRNNTVLRARSLEVRLAPPGGRMQVTFGECELAVGDVPSKEAAVSAAGRTTAQRAEGAEDSPTQVREAEKTVAAEGEAPAGGPRPRGRRESSSPASA